MTLEELLALPDDRLTELVAVEVMGWTRHRMLEPRSDYYSDLQQDWDYTVWVSQWNPLTDMNQLHAVIERKREEWAKTCSGQDWILRTSTYGDVGRVWEAKIEDGSGEVMWDVYHASLARAVCVCAVWDSLQGKGEAG